MKSLEPILSLLRAFYVRCKAVLLEYRLGAADVLSPYAAELALKRAALKDQRHIRVCPNILYR